MFALIPSVLQFYLFLFDRNKLQATQILYPQAEKLFFSYHLPFILWYDYGIQRLEYFVGICKKMVKQTGYVYLIECDGYFKVGKAASVKARLNQLQTGSPHKMNLIASFKSKNCSEDEKRIHEILSDFNVRGEWFSIPLEKMASLKEWFNPSAFSSVKPQVNTNCIRENISFAEWIPRYKEFHHGHEILIEDLLNMQLFAFEFIRRETEFVIERAAEIGDNYALLWVYCILVDKKFTVPSKDKWNPAFIETVKKFGRSNMSWLAGLGAAVRHFYY